MKLAKLSLAAIVAVGAMSTFASASQLEEAIKGVEINGYVRYRFTDNSDANKDSHEFKGRMMVTVPVAENLKAGVFANYVIVDEGDKPGISGGSSFNVKQTWFQYGVDGFSLKAGRMAVMSPWTDDDDDGTIGDGAMMLFTGVPGWTFGGGAYVNVDTISKHDNLYAVGAIGAVGPVNLQLWAANMTHVFDYSVYGDVQFEMAGFSAELQANYLKVTKDIQPSDRGGFYWGGKLGYAMNGFSGTVGYTQNDKKQPIYNLAGTDSSGFIFFGKQLDGFSQNADARTIFGELAYERANYNVGAGFGQTDWVGDMDAKEWYVEAGYKYSKNFKLSTWYSDLSGDAENKKIRFEAKYSF